MIIKSIVSIIIILICIQVHVVVGQPGGADYFERLLGNMRLTPYTGGGGTSAVHAADLNCDFTRSCCWTNVGPPRDELEWVTANTIPDPQRFQSVFGTSQRPTTPFLISSSDAAAASVYAIFSSCALPCQSNTGTLTFKKWTSPGVSIDVCTLPVGTDSYSFCQTVADPGPDVSVQVPPQTGPYQLVIISSNFVQAPAGAAAIDNLAYTADVESCTTVAPTPPPIVTVVTIGPPPAWCSTLRCTFVGSLCGYNGNGSTCPFIATSGRTVVWAGGVPSGPGGGSYAGAGLGPGAKASLQSPTFTTDLPARIGFKYYEGPPGVTLKACVDSDANCPFVSASQTLAGSRAWKDGYIDVPAGTHTIYFTAANEGAELSGVGIADVNLASYGGQTLSC